MIVDDGGRWSTTTIDDGRQHAEHQPTTVDDARRREEHQSTTFDGRRRWSTMVDAGRSRSKTQGKSVEDARRRWAMVDDDGAKLPPPLASKRPLRNLAETFAQDHAQVVERQESALSGGGWASDSIVDNK